MGFNPVRRRRAAEQEADTSELLAEANAPLGAFRVSERRFLRAVPQGDFLRICFADPPGHAGAPNHSSSIDEWLGKSPGVLLFGDFLLDKQEKVTRRTGAEPR